jgi:uncharacterized protein YndB with AHSA1/START domain
MNEIEMSEVFPASAQRIYDAWVDAIEHAKFTDSPATGDPREGGAFTAWDGYIQGKHLALDPGRRIVQAWRSSEFPEGAPDSRLEIELSETDEGTLLTLRHSDLPEGQADAFRKGWVEFYFEPLAKYFKPAAAKKAVAKKPAAKKTIAKKPAAKSVAKKKKPVKKVAKKKAAPKKKTAAKKAVKKKPAKKKTAKKKARAKK